MTASVKILYEARSDSPPGNWTLCFQWCEYRYFDGKKPAGSQMGYRFIYRRPNGNLQAGRAGARILSIAEAEKLIAKARAEGWGNNIAPD